MKHARKPRLLVRASTFVLDGRILRFTLPIHTDGTLTQTRKHFRTTNKTNQEQQLIVRSHLGQERSALIALGVTHVRITRVAPRKLDSVQLWASQKHVQDAVAKILGRDDADWKDGAIKWEVAQRSDEPRTYGVVIMLWNESLYTPPQSTITPASQT